MTHGAPVRARRPEVLPTWLVLPAATLWAASFGIRSAALFERHYAVVFATLVFDGAWLLPYAVIVTLPLKRFRQWRVARPAWPQLVVSGLVRIVVATIAGILAFAWVYFGPLDLSVRAVLAYVATVPVVVLTAVALRRRLTE